MTEVSELSTENQLTLAQSPAPDTSSTLTIPSIRTRRAETTVEIPSGGSLAMAGMIQEQTKQQINGIPGPDAAAGARRAVQEPRLHQPADRADGHRHALRGARGGAEGPVAAGRRLSPTRAIRRPSCSAGSTASTAPRQQGRPARSSTAASSASFSTERRTRRRSMTSIKPPSSAARHEALLAPPSACWRSPAAPPRSPAATLPDNIASTTRGERLSPAPSDRDQGRRRAPSSCSSATSAAASTADQRADVLAFAQAWRREATGGVIIDVPTGTRNERSCRQRRAGGPLDPRRRRRAAGRGGDASLPADRSRASSRPCELALSEDDGGRRAVRAVAVRSRADLRSRAQREPAVLEPRLREPAQPRRHGRQPGRPGAAARRDAALHRAPHHRARQVSPRRSLPRPSIPMPKRARSATSANDDERNASPAS